MITGSLPSEAFRFFHNMNYADVAELADAPDLGSGVHDVQVQVLSSAVWENGSGHIFSGKCGSDHFYFKRDIYGGTLWTLFSFRKN